MLSVLSSVASQTTPRPSLLIDAIGAAAGLSLSKRSAELILPDLQKELEEKALLAGKMKESLELFAQAVEKSSSTYASTVNDLDNAKLAYEKAERVALEIIRAAKNCVGQTQNDLKRAEEKKKEALKDCVEKQTQLKRQQLDHEAVNKEAQELQKVIQTLQGSIKPPESPNLASQNISRISNDPPAPKRQKKRPAIYEEDVAPASESHLNDEEVKEFSKIPSSLDGKDQLLCEIYKPGTKVYYQGNETTIKALGVCQNQIRFKVLHLDKLCWIRKSAVLFKPTKGEIYLLQSTKEKDPFERHYWVKITKESIKKKRNSQSLRLHFEWTDYQNLEDKQTVKKLSKLLPIIPSDSIVSKLKWVEETSVKCKGYLLQKRIQRI